MLLRRHRLPQSALLLLVLAAGLSFFLASAWAEDTLPAGSDSAIGSEDSVGDDDDSAESTCTEKTGVWELICKSEEGTASSAYYPFWFWPLVIIFISAAIILGRLVYGLHSDGKEAQEYWDRWEKGEPPPEEHDNKTPLQRWSKTLRELHEQNKQAPPPGTLEDLYDQRYLWAEPWLNGLRTSATMLGLLFTFIGIALTLDELATALAVTSDSIEESLEKMRLVLPMLGVAFVSSFCGIFVALVISFLHNLFQGFYGRVVSKALVVSAAHLQPYWVRPSGIDGTNLILANLSDRIEKSVVAIEASNLQSTELVSQTEVTLEKLTEVAEQLVLMPEKNQEVWSTVLSRAAEEHDRLVAALSAALNDVRQEVDQLLEKINKAGEKGIHNVAVAMELVRSEGKETLKGLQDTSAALKKHADGFEKVSIKAVSSLEAGSKHLQSMEKSTERFEKALLKVEDITQKSAADRERQITVFQQAFDEVPKMAEVVSGSAAQAAEASKSLEVVLAGEQMQRYLEQLPELIKLSESETKSREVLKNAVGSFREAAESIGVLTKNVTQIGATSERLRLAHEELAKTLEELSSGTLLEAVKDALIETAEAAVSAQEETWTGRYTGILKEQKEVLAATEASNEAVVRSLRTIVKLEKRGIVPRIFGMGSKDEDEDEDGE